MAKNTFRVSIRSKGKANAAAIAEGFNGGGHIHAAGFTVLGRYEDLVREVPRKIESFLRKKANLAAKRGGLPMPAGRCTD